MRVERGERDGVAVLRLHVAPDDVGKVIGRQGRIARALRTLVRASAARTHERVHLDIADQVPDRVQVGRVGRPHGIAGAFVVEHPSEDPERFAVGARLLAGDRELEVLESKRVGGMRLAIRVDGPVERGTPLEVPRESLPDPEEDAYYVFQLVGLRVEEPDGRELGTVASVIDAPANDVLELDSGLLLPLVGACIRDVDLHLGRIVVAPGYADPPDA